jgi:hypothetical protein
LDERQKLLSEIKGKNGEFERCKVRLVVQGQMMMKKDATDSGDFEDSFSSARHASGLRIMLALALQLLAILRILRSAT